jgi:hypothetical protein
MRRLRHYSPGAIVLLFLLFVAAITTPITPIHASNTRRRGRISNASFGMRCGHHGHWHCDVDATAKPARAKTLRRKIISVLIFSVIKAS